MLIDYVHCKHIILGDSADNGYARLLNSSTGDPSASQMITIMEAPPLPPSLFLLWKIRSNADFQIYSGIQDTPTTSIILKVPPRSKSPALTSYASSPGNSQSSSRHHTSRLVPQSRTTGRRHNPPKHQRSASGPSTIIESREIIYYSISNQLSLQRY